MVDKMSKVDSLLIYCAMYWKLPIAPEENPLAMGHQKAPDTPPNSTVDALYKIIIRGQKHRALVLVGLSKRERDLRLCTPKFQAEELQQV